MPVYSGLDLTYDQLETEKCFNSQRDLIYSAEELNRQIWFEKDS